MYPKKKMYPQSGDDNNFVPRREIRRSPALRLFLDSVEAYIEDQRRFSKQGKTTFKRFVKAKIEGLQFSREVKGEVTVCPNEKSGESVRLPAPRRKGVFDDWLPASWFKNGNMLTVEYSTPDHETHKVQATLYPADKREPRYEIDWRGFDAVVKKENDKKELVRFKKRYEQCLRQMELEGEDGQSGFATEPEAQKPDVKWKRHNLRDADAWQERIWFEFHEVEDTQIVLYPTINLYELEQRKKAVKQLLFHPAEHQLPLRELFEEGRTLPTFNPEHVERWFVLTDATRDGAAQQRAFVQKALATPDFAVMEGPPGSGKTTVILELILQLAVRGKRVLLASSTHVAVDNVLERMLDEKIRNVVQTHIFCARVASNETRISVDCVKEEFALKRLMAAQLEPLVALSYDHKATDGQRQLAKAAQNHEAFERFVMEQCNLIAGTMAGLLSHPVIRNPKPGQKPFDYLIVDEASKATVDSFLVPANLCRRWVLVGDVQQLSPYCEADAVADLVAGKTGVDLEQADQIVSLIERRFSYRANPDFAQDIDKRLREQLLPLSDGQNDAIESIRRVSFPSILEAVQRGVAYGDVREVLQNSGVWDENDEDDSDDEEFYDAITQGMPKVYGQEAFDERFESLAFQNRMADEIADIPRKFFYSGRNLATAAAVKKRVNPLAAYRGDENVTVWRTVEKDGDRDRNVNRQEVDRVMQELEKLNEYAAEKHLHLNVGVLSFYRGQERLLRNNATDKKFSHLEVRVSTVDRFQGQEADAILLCFTKWAGKPFYNSPNRLNVALTRARHKLILFGNPQCMTGGGFTEAVRELAQSIPQR